MVVTSRRRGGRIGSSILGGPVAIVLLLGVAGCGATPAPTRTPPASGPGTGATPAPPPSRSPLGPPVLGIDWGKAASVERPEEAFDLGTPGPSPTEDPGDGRSGHPLHFPGQAIMADVVARPTGDLVSVGYVYPGWHPVAWTSAEGSSWALHELGVTDFTFPVSLVANDAGLVVAVGRSGSRPVAWSSADGRAWQIHDVPMLGDGSIAERMTTVVATPVGFLAGGSVGPELFERHARFWTSPDGRTWQPVADDPAAFADAEVRSIVRAGDGYVAVGLVGTAQAITGSVAWTSPDGRTWTRVETPDLALGRTVAVVGAPFGGIVAVGSDLDEHEALTWSSPDGRSWAISPSEPSRQYHGKVRMTDVVAVGDELVGIGNYVGLQRGTAVSWVTTDGRHWLPARSAPVQEQGEPYAVAAGGPGIVIVGSFGAPDDYIPTVWLSPAR
jgi:hypothetical protein